MDYCIQVITCIKGVDIRNPVANDLPIFVDYEETMRNLLKIQSLPGIQYYCPAWDEVYNKEEFTTVTGADKAML